MSSASRCRGMNSGPLPHSPLEVTRLSVPSKAVSPPRGPCLSHVMKSKSWATQLLKTLPVHSLVLKTLWLRPLYGRCSRGIVRNPLSQGVRLRVCKPRSEPGTGLDSALRRVAESALYPVTPGHWGLGPIPGPRSFSSTQTSPKPSDQASWFHHLARSPKVLCDGALNPSKAHLQSPEVPSAQDFGLGVVMGFSLLGDGTGTAAQQVGRMAHTPHGTLEPGAWPAKGLWHLLVTTPKAHQVSLCSQQDEG